MLRGLLLALLTGLALAGPVQAAKPDLVLMITVDQLRGDMPWRLRDRFGSGGFRYLMDQGSSYTNAYLSHAVTITAAGHATLATGGNTPEHGMAANKWFDSDARRPVYCTEDPNHPLIGERPGTSAGRSPANLTSSTIGDELVLASGGKSRVFSVSTKDRSAIIMGGRSGQAWWYSTSTGQYVTSTWYTDAYPDWVADWNKARPADRFKGGAWTLLHDRSSYIFAEQDNREFEKGEGVYGRTFPHTLDFGDDYTFYSVLRYSPMADELTLDFVRELVKAEKIGQRGHTDLLSISFSATDYVGHAFGPNSLEAEDNLLRLDRTLDELLRFIDRKVGLDKTLVVLSADHGVAPAPEHMAAMGFSAERHQPREFMAQANLALREHFGVEQDLAIAFWKPGIYLDRKAIDSLGLQAAEVERVLARKIMRTDGFTLALTRSDLMAGSIPGTEMARRVQASFHPARSGDVLLVHDPFWYLSEDPQGNAAMHGSPYTHDTHVPIMMAGPGIARTVVHRQVAPRDVAATLSTYLGISPPSGSVGKPLTEVFGKDSP